MAITPEALREVDFRTAPLRGYHQDDVDEFLERMAAGIEILLQRVREATEAAVRAEQARADDLEMPPEDEEGMRALMLASQKLADEALDEARARAQHMLSQAEEYARVLMDEAVAATRQTREGASRAAEADLRRLRSARDRLRLEALAVEQDVVAAPLPTARPSWPNCLHAVEQTFPAPAL